MKPEIRTRLKGFLGNEDGIMAVVFALCLPVFVVVAALAIDMGYSYWKRNALQVDASASSLAGAGTLMDDGVYDPVNEIIIYATVDPDGDGVPNDPGGAVIYSEAMLYAEKNIPNEDILAAIDLHAGNWEPTTRTFTSAGTWNPATDPPSFNPAPQAYDANTGTWTSATGPIVPLNAVMATTRRADDGPNDNPLPLFLAAAVGLPAVNINTTAIATVGAQTLIGFNGCLMALNPDEDATFYANGTNDIITQECDIYINSDAACAADLIGNAHIEVGDEDTPGNIYIAGDYCQNPNVDINCNNDADGDGIADPGMECPEIGAEKQIDPFAYTYADAYALDSGLTALQNLQCGKHYVNDGSSYTDTIDLSTYYTNPEHDGTGNFKIDGQKQSDLFDGAPAPCDPPVGDLGSGLLAGDGVTCVVPILYPAGDQNEGDPMIFGTSVVTDVGDWSWNIANQRFEFSMQPGAYCGGIEARVLGRRVH
jgi:hypothetical protein